MDISGIQALIPITVTFVVAGLMIAYGSMITSDVQDQIDNDCGGVAPENCSSYAHNVTDGALENLDNIAGSQGTLGSIAIAAIVIAVLFGAFAVFQNRGMGGSGM